MPWIRGGFAVESTGAEGLGGPHRSRRQLGDGCALSDGGIGEILANRGGGTGFHGIFLARFNLCLFYAF